MSFDQFEDLEKKQERLVEVDDEGSTAAVDTASLDLDRLVGGTVGGHFEILSRLGEGGMSVVYKAHHLLLDKLVAIKFIQPRFVSDAKAIARFQQEAKAACELQHPNICATREFGILESDNPYIVMDLMDGPSLSELIHEKHRFEKKEAIKIILQACHGLKHAHARGVVHRDIKPGNMVLANEKDGSQSLKIVDFGIAKLARDDEAGVDLTRTGDIFGTPKYMSPEQCRGKKVDKRSDIYSLGCVFYEILTGKAPFESDTAIELLMMHANQQADLNHPSLTAGLKAILFKTLAKDPENRYQSTEELARDLDLYLKGRDPDSLGSYRRARLGRWLNLKTTAIALLLIGLPLGAITVKENLWQKPTPIGMSEQYTQIIKDGDTAIGAARFEQAENLYHKAVSLAKTGKDRSASEKLQIEALARLSKVYEKTGQNHKKDANDSRIRALLKSAIADTTDIVEDKRDWYSALPSDDTLAHGVERARLLKDKSQEFISFGNYKTAERLEREVLALQEKWLGEDNPAIPVTLNQLGVIVVTQGKVAEAKPLWERGLSLAQKNLPASSPATPLLWANLGRMFQHEENNEKAELYFQTAISLAKKNIGKGSPSHLAALKDYAAFLNGTKRLDAASKVDQEIKHLLGK